MRSIKINLMLSMSLLFSIILFFLMDQFVANDESEDPSVSCVLVRGNDRIYELTFNTICLIMND